MSSRRTAYVHLGYGFGAAAYRRQYHAGLTPDPVPYGFHHAQSPHWNVLYSEDHPESPLTRFLRRALNSVLGFDLVHAWRNRRALHGAHIVWTMEERQGLAVLALRNWLGPWSAAWRKTPPVILQIVWLFDRWASMHPLRRALLAPLLRRAAAVTVHSRNYVGLAAQLQLPILPLLLPFGISADSFPLRPHDDDARTFHTPIRLLAMGSDPTRDWETFLQAFSNDSRFDLVAISPQLTPDRVAGIANLRAPKSPTMQQFVDFYRWADVVVIPMVPNLYSGITVALEATRQGILVISSRTGGVPTYLDESEALFVTPSDPQALREAVLSCLQQATKPIVIKAQARFASEDYTTRGMALRYVALSERILAPTGNVTPTT